MKLTLFNLHQTRNQEKMLHFHKNDKNFNRANFTQTSTFIGRYLPLLVS